MSAIIQATFETTKTKNMKAYFLPFVLAVSIVACSKSGGNSSNNNNSNANGTGLWPLAISNVWDYRLKTYNTTTGALLDSSDFTLTVTDTMSTNGATYYKVINSLTGTGQWFTNLNGSTVGSIDSVNGVKYYNVFVSSTGDSTKAISNWMVSLSGSCTGDAYLFGNYADTTLVNLDGTVYSSSIKNDIVVFDCSGNKATAAAYFVKQGVGLVRMAGYIYDASGGLHMSEAWILESSTLH